MIHTFIGPFGSNGGFHEANKESEESAVACRPCGEELGAEEINDSITNGILKSTYEINVISSEIDSILFVDQKLQRETILFFQANHPPSHS